MFSYANQFPDECEKAWKQIEDFSLPDAYRSVDKIVILGMGGSAIGGEMVKYLSELYSAVPIWICRGYTLPQFVDERTLVIASSYSGNTEETVSTFQQATGIHCPKLAITTAGKIGVKVWIYKGEILEHDPMASERRLQETGEQRARSGRAAA